MSTCYLKKRNECILKTLTVSVSTKYAEFRIVSHCLSGLELNSEKEKNRKIFLINYHCPWVMNLTNKVLKLRYIY